MNSLLGRRTAICPAPDLARAKAWYAQVLEQAPYFDEPCCVGFEAGGGIKVAAVTDPFGNRLGIIENPLFDLKKLR